MTADTSYPARGAWAKVVRNSDSAVIHQGYTAWQGSTPGCFSSPLSLDSTETYNLKVYGVASVNGNTLVVYDDDTSFGIKIYGPASWSPTASGTYSIHTPDGVDEWLIANAVEHAMFRRSATLSGETFEFVGQTCPPPASGSCFNTASGRVYISTSGADNKFVIVHEFGHMLAARANDDGTCGTSSCGASASYAAPHDNCYTSSAAGSHSFHEKEYASAAAWEGIAHYYAAVAFNDTSEGDCAFVYYKNQDWNLDNDAEDDQEPSESNPAVSCEYYPTTTQGDGTCDPRRPDYLGTCYEDGDGDPCDIDDDGNCDNRSTEYDWLRFWWDLDTDGDLTTPEIYGIWVEAEPDTWNETDTGSDRDDPANRLRDAADTNEFLTEWDMYDEMNGVQR